MISKRSVKKTILFMQKIVAYVLITLIYLIRPLLGPMNICPFTIGCTQYALKQLQKESLGAALKKIINRLTQCHPFGKRL